MYIPSYYKEENPEDIRSFIKENSFAILVSQHEGKPWATHLPLILSKYSEEKEYLFGHISKANKQWKSFSENEKVLAIFSGPHAYISSSWYDHENAPTWNYQAVHIYGKLKVIDGQKLKKHMTALVDTYEKDMKNPISIPGMSDGYYDKEIRGVVGFTIEIANIQAAYKLSQNQDEKNYQNIISGLNEKGDSISLQMMELMAKRKGNEQD